jgi:hypothetical protein
MTLACLSKQVLDLRSLDLSPDKHDSEGTKERATTQRPGLL